VSGVNLSELPLWQRRNWSAEVSTAAPLLAELAEDDDTLVRAGVAENVWTPPDVLIQLATDRAELVRLGVAKNRRTSPEVLARLGGDESRRVRQQALANPTAASDDRSA
jgi:hypothetical protein